MGLMRRLSLYFKAKANRALDSMEDPRETLDYFYQLQLEGLIRTRRMLADQHDARKAIEDEIARLQQQWTTTENASSKEGKEHEQKLADKTISRLVIIERNIQSLRREHMRALDQERQVARNAEELEGRVESLRTYKEVLKADLRLADQMEAANTIHANLRGRDAAQSSEIDDDHAIRVGQMLDLISPDQIHADENIDED